MNTAKDKERISMSISKAVILTGIIMLGIIANISPIAADCTPMNVVAGDSITLTGPTPPDGANYHYKYIWTVDGSDNSHLVTATPGVSITFTIPATGAANTYTATLSVETVTTAGTSGGCILQSCVTINVQSSFTCGLTGAQTVCQTDSSEVYNYAGTVDFSNKKTAYLVWYVGTQKIKDNDQTGQVTVDWSHYYSPSVPGTQTFNVIVEAHSAKAPHALLATCTLPVAVLPSPVTTITPT